MQRIAGDRRTRIAEGLLRLGAVDKMGTGNNSSGCFFRWQEAGVTKSGYSGRNLVSHSQGAHQLCWKEPGQAERAGGCEIVSIMHAVWHVSGPARYWLAQRLSMSAFRIAAFAERD